jgi:hypothetical protein
VLFVERSGVRYAIKETTTHMAEREIRHLQEIARRGIPTITAVGTVSVTQPPILLDERGPGGSLQYLSGDRGYTVTRLALRVVPHVLLYRLTFTRRTKERLLSAVAVLMVELHEHGIYWGDPSLANILIRIDGKRVLALMADGETTELFAGPISEGLRLQDLASFAESLAWQAEDLRLAHGLAEDQLVLDEADFRYFERHYRWLRRVHERFATDHLPVSALYQTQRFLQSINRRGFSLLNMTGKALLEFATVRPGWYQRRLSELLHITIPRRYARRFYNLILGHQALLSEAEQREVSIEEAAQHWYTAYHLPALLLLRRVLTHEQDTLQAYFEIMLHKWKLSEQAGYEIPLEEATLSWAMQQAHTGELGPIDPALQARWTRELSPTAQALEVPLIEGEQLDPLLSTGERPLVHLPEEELEAKLPELLGHDASEPEDH